MKNRLFLFVGIMVLSSVWIVFLRTTNRKTTTDPVPGSCTIFSASVGNKVLFGNNEDYVIWAPVLIFRKAATVEEAIEIAGKYQRENWFPKSGYISYQLNFADASGDAVVISVDENGELAFTRKRKDKNYLISTNFNKANPENAMEYPCSRYNKAEEMLERIESENDLTVDYIKSILDSVHVKGLFNTTLYSNIFDLKNGVIYLYHWHQFDEVVMLNVDEELAKGKIYVRIQDLFTDATLGNASREYIGSIFSLTISIIVGTGVMVLAIHYIKKRKLKVPVAHIK